MGDILIWLKGKDPDIAGPFILDVSFQVTFGAAIANDDEFQIGLLFFLLSFIIHVHLQIL